MRLNVWTSAEHGFQANLARSGQGWTVDHHTDPLEAMAKVLRLQFGAMLDRQRTENPEPRRRLYWHPESEHLFVTEAPFIGDGLAEEVTGVAEWEAMWWTKEADRIERQRRGGYRADTVEDLIG